MPRRGLPSGCACGASGQGEGFVRRRATPDGTGARKARQATMRLRSTPGCAFDCPGSSVGGTRFGENRPPSPRRPATTEARRPSACEMAWPRAVGCDGFPRAGGFRTNAGGRLALRPRRVDWCERSMAAMGRSALRPVEVWIRSERARSGGAELRLHSGASWLFRCCRTRGGLEVSPRPSRPSGRGGAGRSRPAAGLRAT